MFFLYQQFQDEQNYPVQHLSELSGVLSQLQGGQVTPRGSSTAQGVGTALGMFGQLAPLFKGMQTPAAGGGGGSWTPPVATNPTGVYGDGGAWMMQP